MWLLAFEMFHILNKSDDDDDNDDNGGDDENNNNNLYWAKENTKKVYNNIMNLIKL